MANWFEGTNCVQRKHYVFLWWRERSSFSFTWIENSSTRLLRKLRKVLRAARASSPDHVHIGFCMVFLSKPMTLFHVRLTYVRAYVCAFVCDHVYFANRRLLADFGADRADLRGYLPCCSIGPDLTCWSISTGWSNQQPYCVHYSKEQGPNSLVYLGQNRTPRRALVSSNYLIITFASNEQHAFIGWQKEMCLLRLQSFYESDENPIRLFQLKLTQ